MSKRKDDDLTVLRLKLEEVSRYIALFEERFNAVESAVHTEAITQYILSASSLITTLKDAMKPVAAMGVAKSGIEADLAQAKNKLGQKWTQEVARGHSLFLRCADEVRKLGGQPDDSEEFAHAVLRLAAAFDEFAKLALLPAKLLREDLTERLRRKGGEPAETEGQRNRALRDEQVRAIAKKLGTNSPSDVLKAAQADPIIASLSVKLSIDVVRNVLGRGKSESRKKPVKQKPRYPQAVRTRHAGN